MADDCDCGSTCCVATCWAMAVCISAHPLLGLPLTKRIDWLTTCLFVHICRTYSYNHDWFRMAHPGPATKCEARPNNKFHLRRLPWPPFIKLDHPPSHLLPVSQGTSPQLRSSGSQRLADPKCRPPSAIRHPPDTMARPRACDCCHSRKVSGMRRCAARSSRYVYAFDLWTLVSNYRHNRSTATTPFHNATGANTTA